jgi:hypothetical protein
MTYNLDNKLKELESARLKAIASLEKLKETAGKAKGEPGDSFAQKIEDAGHQISLLDEHISALKLEKAQSWEKSAIGNDVEY